MELEKWMSIAERMRVERDERSDELLMVERSTI